jgi:hypothetical protein
MFCPSAIQPSNRIEDFGDIFKAWGGHDGVFWMPRLKVNNERPKGSYCENEWALNTTAIEGTDLYVFSKSETKNSLNQETISAPPSMILLL